MDFHKIQVSGQFLAQNLGFIWRKSQDFLIFSESHQLWGAITFFLLNRFLNFLDSMERYMYESNSFISAILDTQSKPGAPIGVHLWRGFSKMGIHSPIIHNHFRTCGTGTRLTAPQAHFLFGLGWTVVVRVGMCVCGYTVVSCAKSARRHLKTMCYEWNPVMKNDRWTREWT